MNRSYERIDGAWRKQRGYSLIEILVAIGIMTILLAIATKSSDFIKGHRLSAASRGLFADLQKVRQNALTTSTPPPAVASRGFGIRFDSNGAYTAFEFNDANANFLYDSGEEYGGKQTTFPKGVTVTLGDSGDPTGTDNVLIFDKRGITRAYDWSVPTTSRVYVMRLAGAAQARCVQIDGVSIREGKWDGATCN